MTQLAVTIDISLGPRRSGGGADEGEEESAWYLLYAHARIYRTFYRIIIRICTSNVSIKINYSSKMRNEL